MPIKIDRFDEDEEKLDADVKREINTNKANKEGERARRIQSIMAKIEAELRKGNEIKVTEEMKVLGIDIEVSNRIFSHSQNRRMLKKLGMLGDDEKATVTFNLRSALD